MCAHRHQIATLLMNPFDDLVHGLQDAVIPFAHARQVSQGLDLATAKWLDRCGHFPQIEHAATVNTYLTEFLFEPASR